MKTPEDFVMTGTIIHGGEKIDKLFAEPPKATLYIPMKHIYFKECMISNGDTEIRYELADKEMIARLAQPYLFSFPEQHLYVYPKVDLIINIKGH